MTKPISKRKLAAALGISPPRVTALARRGMPTDSVQAAERWRARNLDPSWARKHPPVPIELSLAEPELVINTDAAEVVLCRVVPPLLWHAALHALAIREAEIPANAEQVLRAAGLYALLCMHRVADALGRDDLKFAVSHFPARGSPEEAALIGRLETILCANPITKGNHDD